jgi:hypothetical protein
MHNSTSLEQIPPEQHNIFHTLPLPPVVSPLVLKGVQSDFRNTPWIAAEREAATLTDADIATLRSFLRSDKLSETLPMASLE